MRSFFSTRSITLVVIVSILFGCNKQEDKTTEKQFNTVESILGIDLLKQIETANEYEYQVVSQSIEELKEEGEIVTIEQINERIEENTVVFKSSTNLEVPITISQEKLEKYANDFSNRFLSVVDSSDENTTKELLLSSFETEKDKFVKQILDNSSLQTSEKRDIIAYILIAKGKIFTQIDVLDSIRELVSGEVSTKGLWSDLRNWFKRNKECIGAIIGTGGGIYKVATGDYLEGSISIVTGVVGIIEECLGFDVI